MKRLRIAIDPRLTELYGPEINWTWQLLLSGIGWSWEQVSLRSICEVAYVSDPALAPAAKLCIRANPEAWGEAGSYRLNRIKKWNGLSHPIYEGTSSGPNPIRAGVGRVVCLRDIIFDVYWLVTGQEERYWRRDHHGFCDLTGTAILHEQLPRLALASHIEQWLEKEISQLGHEDPQPRWPCGKQAAAAVSHDVDYPEVKRFIEPVRVITRLGRRGLAPAWEILVGRRDYWQFEAWVQLEKRLQTRSAFYFVSRQGSLLEYLGGRPDPFYDVSSPQFNDLFRYLADEGFEIGLHASYDAYQSLEKLSLEKQILEEAANQTIVGNRHHYWHLNPNDVEETLLIHEQVGLKYDTSLSHKRYLGWRRGLSRPYFPFHQGERRALNTLQIPTCWMDNQLFGMRRDNRGNRLELLKGLVKRTVNQKGCFLIDIHDYVFDDDLYPNWGKTFYLLWQYLQERGDFWIATPAQIAEHWIDRHQTLVEASIGLTENKQYIQM